MSEEGPMREDEGESLCLRGVRTWHEQCVQGVFGDVLGRPVDRIDFDSSFFTLGGTSTQAAQLASRIGEAFDIAVPVQAVFEQSTVRDLGQWLEERTKRLPQGAPLALSPEGRNRTLVCIHPSSGFGRPYRVLLPHLAADMSVYALEARGLRDGEALPATLDEMCADYIGQIQRLQACGPYHLLGWSFGAIPAHAIATAMQARGLEVDSLVLIDGFPFDGEPWIEQMVSSHRAHWSQEILSFREVRDACPERQAAMLDRLCAIKRNNVRLQAYENRAVFMGDALLVNCGAHPFSWNAYVSGTLQEVSVPFGHNVLMMEEAAAFYGPKIADYLGRGIRGGAPRGA
ncbi:MULTISPECIES: alpha/beta fold hydrolase [unclassified Xanthomonas]|uniref:alpha/beta fold hydrolase n=1 Tax=Xanthomonas sp. LMG 9002 TaxID=1591158 RepID=UPI00137086B1|nr:alpha/beta fold hydrolase [Xanthomonas sp. LMG 9002]MXV08552.1 alpha/beta fold hydrolase [Xanthomonas sp. LMG 9002]